MDANGDSYIDIEVSNPLDWKSPVKCLIDTGFTGFIAIPMLQAFPIGLLLIGTIPVTMADGTTDYKLACLGTAWLEKELQVGVIIIEPQAGQASVGMEFLRKFKKKLIVNPHDGLVELVQAEPPPPPPPPVASAPPHA